MAYAGTDRTGKFDIDERLRMGQAKKRGNEADRIAQALARIDALKPEYLVCNQCQAHITNITTLDSRGLLGIEAAFAGHCECGHDTIAMRGEPEAVSMALQAYADSINGQGIMGVQQIEKT